MDEVLSRINGGPLPPSSPDKARGQGCGEIGELFAIIDHLEEQAQRALAQAIAFREL